MTMNAAIALARKLLNDGEAGQAHQLLAKAVSDYGLSLPALEWQYVAHKELNNSESGDKILVEMARHFPWSARPHYLRGKAEMEEGRLAEAITSFVEADLREPEDVTNLEALAYCYRRLGERTQELLVARRLVSAAPFRLVGYFFQPAPRWILDILMKPTNVLIEARA
ncbi:MAG: hypothetical protein AAGH57_06270 [Pseudomonadota bacterium]